MAKQTSFINRCIAEAQALASHEAELRMLLQVWYDREYGTGSKAAITDNESDVIAGQEFSAETLNNFMAMVAEVQPILAKHHVTLNLMRPDL